MTVLVSKPETEALRKKWVGRTVEKDEIERNNLSVIFFSYLSLGKVNLLPNYKNNLTLASFWRPKNKNQSTKYLISIFFFVFQVCEHFHLINYVQNEEVGTFTFLITIRHVFGGQWKLFRVNLTQENKSNVFQSTLLFSQI